MTDLLEIAEIEEFHIYPEPKKGAFGYVDVRFDLATPDEYRRFVIVRVQFTDETITVRDVRSEAPRYAAALLGRLGVRFSIPDQSEELQQRWR